MCQSVVIIIKMKERGIHLLEIIPLVAMAQDVLMALDWIIIVYVRQVVYVHLFKKLMG